MKTDVSPDQIRALNPGIAWNKISGTEMQNLQDQVNDILDTVHKRLQRHLCEQTGHQFLRVPARNGGTCYACRNCDAGAEVKLPALDW